jgi:hypothetical protein
MQYRRNPSIEEAPLGADLMLFDPTRSQFFVLNSTMSHLWRQCDDAKSLDCLVNSLSSAFSEADEHPVAREVEAALDELLALGVVTKV